MMQIKGVMFDLDGTLGDSVPVSVWAIVRALEAFSGKTYTYEQITALFGPTEQGILRQLLPNQDWEASYQRFLQEYEALHQEGDYGAFPGIPELVALLHDHQVLTAVVTGKGLNAARISLRYFGLADTFDIVEAGSMEGSIKDVCIRKVANIWQVPLEDIIYIGDAVTDVGLARKAGVQPVSAAWAGTHTPEELAAENPYKLFTQVADLHAWLSQQVNGVSE